MLIPIYLIRACGRSPSATGWLLAPLGVGMMCVYPLMGALTKRFGIRKVSAGGALLAFAGTLPFLYLASHGLVLAVLASALFIRGAGLSAIGIRSISAAYASVERADLPMATTALNFVQRLGGPTLNGAKEQGHEKTSDVSDPALLQAVEALADQRRISNASVYRTN
jgi:predicted MFS family arabinose efflux permease